MLFFYNVGVRLYYFFIFIASFNNKKAMLWLKGRKDIFKHISDSLNPNEQRTWIHCASLGEFEQGRPIIEGIKEKYPQYKIVLTFFSPSGFEVRKNYNGADYIFYLPLDTKTNAKEFLRLVNPELAIFIKYEFWYHYLSQLKKLNIPSYVVSAIFRPEQVFFKWYGRLFRKALNGITHIFVQNKISSNLLKTIGINHVSVCGDTRFDRVYSIYINAKPISQIEKFKGSDKIIIAGSTWEADEDILVDCDFQLKNNYKLIIAPHEIADESIKKLIAKLANKYPENDIVRFSEITESEISNKRILIIDNVGMLSNLYAYGTIAYIGGGFGKGIHNVLEATTFGLPVFFGPNYQKFQEAKDLIQLRAAYSINNASELMDAISNLPYSEASLNAKQYVESKIGGTEMVLNNIFGNS
jgi:3-deoxy-D-manno-octulosonic-acid transferase